MGRPLNRPLPKWCTISVGSSDGMAPRVSNDLVSDGQVMSKIRGKVSSPQESTKSQEGEAREEERREEEGRRRKEETRRTERFNGVPSTVNHSL